MDADNFVIYHHNMNYNFYADKKDKLDILEFIFKNTDLHIYDLSSPYSQETCEYKTVDEISSKFDLVNGGKDEITFQLWSPRHKGSLIFRKIELNPKYCKGHTFRYATEGWGLIQVYFGGIKNGLLSLSTISHSTEKRALKWEGVNRDMGLVSDWDWTEIQTTARKLKYQIHHKLAIRKLGSIGILNGADKLEKHGVRLSHAEYET
jgi:hypothetical protein